MMVNYSNMLESKTDFPKMDHRIGRILSFDVLSDFELFSEKWILYYEKSMHAFSSDTYVSAWHMSLIYITVQNGKR